MFKTTLAYFYPYKQKIAFVSIFSQILRFQMSREDQSWLGQGLGGIIAKKKGGIQYFCNAKII